MSELTESQVEAIQLQFEQLAFNKLYKICYKNITAQRGYNQFLQSDEENIAKCHQKLLEAFKIILPSVLHHDQNE